MSITMTRRQQLIQRLSEGPATVRSLATELGVPLRLVVEDLGHIRRSLRDRKLVVEPAQCNDCGLVFTKRERFTAPSRCPVCRSENTSEPELRIA